MQITTLAIIFTWITLESAAAQESCGIYPPAVRSLGYGGMLDCELKAIGARALWRGLKGDEVQVTRLTFGEGHLRLFRTVTITELRDGSAVLKVDGDNLVDNAFTDIRPLRRRTIKLTKGEIARLNALGEASGTWAFETGTWDREGLFLHCQVLDLERINAAGYRSASVNISCNRPQKLMPFVLEVMRLAKMREQQALIY